MRIDELVRRKRYIVLFILGMLVFLYPTFSNIYYNYITSRNTGIILPPTDTTQSNPTGKAEADSEGSSISVSNEDFQKIGSDQEMKPLLSKELEYLKAYNEKLWNISGNTTDPFGEDDGKSNNIDITEDADGSSIFAYIKIDKINQTLPIYLGATNEHLKKGVAVIQGTSIPVGGVNTNSVIAGHTGLVRKFFTDLPQLKPGDEIEITNRWETLYYKVTGNKIIWPYQEEYLSVVTGKDMITLLTCYHSTPENDRLIVFAERYHPEEKKDEKKQVKTQEKADTNSPSYLSQVEVKVKPWYERPQTIAACIAVIMLCLFLYTLLKKRKVNNKQQ